MALLQDYNKLFEHTDNIKKIYVNNSVVWPAIASSGPDYTEPLYLKNTSNETKTVKTATTNVEISYDKNNWETMTRNVYYNISPNSKIWLRKSTNAFNSKIMTTCDVVGGNVMSLLYGSEFTGQTEFPFLTATKIFSTLFRNSALIDASKLLLPATTLASQCYYGMFYGCTSLTTAPVLPATTLASQCYCGMFRGCTSLTTAPILPATTLASYCYSSMFSGCTSLTTAPVLPATTLASECYNNMFYGCTSLTTAPVLPATTLASYCYSSMFKGCTSLTIAPVLPATTLLSNCYTNMFRNCSSLNYIKCLATYVTGTSNWVNSVAAQGTFVKSSTMEDWPTGVSGIPTDWTVIDV